MSEPGPIQVRDAQAETPGVMRAPHVRVARFRREVSTPAALPWRQRQAAELDARHGSPLPLEEVSLQVVRLEPWRLGRPGRFEVAYARLKPGEKSVQPSASGALAGVRDVMIALLPTPATTGSSASSARLLAPAVLLIAAVVAMLLGSIAWNSRSEQAAEITDLQARALAVERRAEAATRLQKQTEALVALGWRAHSPAAVLADMGWLSAHLDSDAKVRAFHWRSGVTAVEVQGAGAPFVGLPDQTHTASRRLSTDAWLWGVKPPNADRDAPSP